MIQVYKIMHGIDKVDKDKFFTVNRYSATRGHSLKLFKKRSRLLFRANSFSNRVVDSWNSLTEDIVNAPSLNEDTHTSSAHPATHLDNTPEIEHRTRMHQKRPMGLIRCLHRYIRYISEGYIHWLYWNSLAWSSSDVSVMLKCMKLHLSVFRDFWKLILK